MLLNLKSDLRPLLVFKDSASFKEVEVTHISPQTSAPLRTVRARRAFSGSSLQRVDRLEVFTKRRNPNKLYLSAESGVFLSPGIVLRFMRQGADRFLKKRLKVWHNYVKALSMLQVRPYVATFRDLFGKKSAFLAKISSSKVKILWVFVRMSRIEFSSNPRSARRIKRWIKKKYYQLEVKERA